MSKKIKISSVYSKTANGRQEKTRPGCNSLTKNPGETNDFLLETFLVNEQIHYSRKIQTETEQRQRELVKKFKPVISELDGLIASPQTQLAKKPFSQNFDQNILPDNQVKIQINQNGEVKKSMNYGSAGSIHTINLKGKNFSSPMADNIASTPERLSRAFTGYPVSCYGDEGVSNNSFLRGLIPRKKVRDLSLKLNAEVNGKFNPASFIKPEFDSYPPKTSLLRKENFLSKLKKNIFSSRYFYSTPNNRNAAWFYRLKMTLNFTLIALLLVLPIRILFFYQHIEKTKGQVLGISEEAMDDLSQATQAASQANWQNAGLYFEQANDNFNLALNNLKEYNKILLTVAKNLPAAGDLLVTAESILGAGNNLSGAAAKISMALSALKTDNDINQTLTDNLLIINNAITSATQEINLALTQLNSIEPRLLPVKYRDYFVQIKDKIPLMAKSLTSTQKLLDFSLVVLGHNQPMRYLFLFQNNNEIRATGGFLGSAALVDIKQGKITDIEVPPGGLYDLKGDFFEKISSPAPMQLLGYPWMIWDANWWPDYSVSAKKIIWFWEQSGWPTVDGVIAFNASLLPEIIKTVGNIEMPEYNQILTPDNVVMAIQHEVEFEFDKSGNQPKKFIADLMPIVIEKLLKVPTNQALPLFLTLNRGLAEKDIQFYFSNEELENFAAEANWAGKINQTDKDYLMVVNQNIAGGKSDAVISQEVKHYVYIQPDGGIVVSVAVSRTHNGDTSDVFQRVQNNSYIRIYTPLGSRLKEVTGFDVIDPELFKKPYEGYHLDEDLRRISGEAVKDAKTNTDVYNEFDKTVFGNWLQIRPGETKTITFSYELPFKLDFAKQSWWRKNPSQKYSLLIQSQSGLKDNNFSSQLFIPKGYNFKWAQGTLNNKISDNKIEFNGQLNSDQYYGVLIEKSGSR